MVINLYADERLVRVTEEVPTPEPIIVCSMGLKMAETSEVSETSEVLARAEGDTDA